MSLKDGEIHAVSALGSVLLAGALSVSVLYFAETKNADAGPALEEMEAIEASLAVKKAPAKQPQKKIEPKVVEDKPDGVSRDEKKIVEENVCTKDADCKTGEVCKKGKCEKEKVAKPDEKIEDMIANLPDRDPDAIKG